MSRIDPNLYRYIWRHSRNDQLWMLVVILLSMPTYFLSLDLPKRIVNGPIQGRGFENPDDTAFFLTTWLPLPEWLTGGPILLFKGIEFERIGYLFALSLLFLALVAANGMFKRYINTFKGRMGERMLRRLRYELVDIVLRYPLSRFRRTKPAEIASMVKDEVEPLGGFIGDAFTQPLFLGGQAITSLAFIFVQNLYLGFITLVMVGFQGWLVPTLRRQLIKLQKKQQLNARHLAGRVGEIVEGIQEVHANDTSTYERSDIAGTLAKSFFLRFELYQRKFTIKFLNNLLIQFLAFLFYAVGGYLAIRGTLDLGQLVAVIAAYKELPDPIRGLIDYDQARLQVDSRYSQVIDYFASDQLQDEASQTPRNERPEALRKGYEFANLQVSDESGLKLIEKATASIGTGEQVALVGAVNSGATHLAETLARLQRHSGGRLELNGAPLDSQREAVTGRRLAYIDGGVYFPQGTIFDALTYVLKNQPNGDLEAEDSAARVRGRELVEARRSGNTDLDPRADWIDRERVGAANDAALAEEIRKVLADVDMEQEVRALGLRGVLDPQKQPELCNNLLVARNKFRAHLGDLGLAGIVEPFDPAAYNNQATLGENLLFGTATAPAFDPAAFSGNETVRKLLEQTALDERLFAMGREVAATTIELFGDLKPDNPFFDQLDYMNADEIPVYRAVLGRIANHPMKDVSEEDRRLVLKLPFAYVESRNRLDLLDDELKARIVDARGALRKQLESLDPCPVNFYDPDRYIPSATVIDNVLFGRVSASVAEANQKVAEAIRNLLGEMQMADEIFRIGLDFNIGAGGKRLSESQRQKLHLARALLKKPDFLLVNQALNTLDSRAQKAAIENVLAKASGRDGHRFGVVWAPMNPAFAALFPRVLVFERGVLTADGSPGKLQESSAAYREIVGT